MSNDPLLQPFQLKHLTLRNRIMTTSHEPAYPEDGMPKERYAAYHAERARAGVAPCVFRGGGGGHIGRLKTQVAALLAQYTICVKGQLFYSTHLKSDSI